jgi:hypothetical protein
MIKKNEEREVYESGETDERREERERERSVWGGSVREGRGERRKHEEVKRKRESERERVRVCKMFTLIRRNEEETKKVLK